MKLDVWSDVVCPWCYVGKRRLEAALAAFPHRERVTVTWRSFELDPSAPKAASEPIALHLARKYRRSPAQAEQMLRQMTATAAAEGLAFDFSRMRTGNTFDAHRLLHLAKERGAQDAVKERFVRGYFCEGAAIGEPATLERLAVEAGLDRDEVRAVLAGERYGAEVRADERQAAEYGIQGVPFFVIASRYGVSGAQPAEVLGRVLAQVHQEEDAAAAPGEACGPDGC